LLGADNVDWSVKPAKRTASRGNGWAVGWN
jgi:hypothetical protein